MCRKENKLTTAVDILEGSRKWFNKSNHVYELSFDDLINKIKFDIEESNKELKIYDWKYTSSTKLDFWIYSRDKYFIRMDSDNEYKDITFNFGWIGDFEYIIVVRYYKLDDIIKIIVCNEKKEFQIDNASHISEMFSCLYNIFVLTKSYCDYIYFLNVEIYKFDKYGYKKKKFFAPIRIKEYRDNAIKHHEMLIERMIDFLILFDELFELNLKKSNKKIFNQFVRDQHSKGYMKIGFNEHFYTVIGDQKY